MPIICLTIAAFLIHFFTSAKTLLTQIAMYLFHIMSAINIFLRLYTSVHKQFLLTYWHLRQQLQDTYVLMILGDLIFLNACDFKKKVGTQNFGGIILG